MWLVNTGWSGGAYGVGERMKLSHTRAMVRAALAGKLDGVAVKTDPVFGLARAHRRWRACRTTCSTRARTWKDGAAYDAQAKKLAGDVPRQHQEVRRLP